MADPNPYESPRVTILEKQIDGSDDTRDPLKPLEPFGVLAFSLAVLLLFLPVLADIAAALMATQRLFLALLLALVTYVAVLIPTIVSWRRHLTEPNRWRGYGYLLGATFILAFHALLAALGIVAHVLG